MNFGEIMSRLSTGRALMLGLILGAFYYFLVFDSGYNLKNQISEGQARIEELKHQIEDNQKKLDRAMVYKKTAAEVGSTINKLLSLIPEKFGMPDLMRIVSNEAKVAGSSLADIKPEETRVSSFAKEFEEISVSVDLTGSFLQHMIFLSNLTKINSILVTKRYLFDLVREGRGEDPPVVKLTAQIAAYRYRGLGTATGAAPGTQPPGAGK